MEYAKYIQVLSSISIADYAVILAYVFFILYYGIRISRWIKTSDDYLVAGRNIGFFVLVGTLTMTELNSATTIGWSQFGYRGAFWSISVVLSFALGMGAFAILMSKRWKRLDATTFCDMVEVRYGRKTRLFAAILMISSLSVLCPGFLKAASMVVSICIGDYSQHYAFVTTAIICVVVLIFTMAGGLMSIVYVDLASFILTLITVPILFFVTFHYAGGFAGYREFFNPQYLTLNPAGKWADPALPVGFVISMYVLVLLVYPQLSPMSQRMFAAKTVRTAYLSMIWSTVLIVIFYSMYLLTAASARVAFAKMGLPDLPMIDQEKVIPLAILKFMPPVFKGLMISMILAICQTTLSCVWATNSSLITHDIYQALFKPRATSQEVIHASRIITLVVALFTVILALFGERVVNYLFFSNIFLISMVFLTVGGFLFWQASPFTAWFSTILSVVSGFIIWYGKTDNDPIKGIQTIYLFGNKNMKLWSGTMESEPWLFAYCVIAMPVILILTYIISMFYKDNEQTIRKKVAFFNCVGAPFVGKKAYEKARARLEPDTCQTTEPGPAKVGLSH